MRISLSACLYEKEFDPAEVYRLAELEIFSHRLKNAKAIFFLLPNPLYKNIPVESVSRKMDFSDNPDIRIVQEKERIELYEQVVVVLLIHLCSDACFS